MQEEIASLRDALQEKRIRLTEAGSIAEAAASISNVFSAAQTTADLYLHEIFCMKEETEKECAQTIEEAKQAAAALCAEGEKQYAALYARYRTEYKKLQELRAEVQELEKSKKQISQEGAVNG